MMDRKQEMTRLHLKELETINAQTLQQEIEQGKITLIDVREPGEYAGEHIPDAISVPLSRFDPASIPQQPDKQLVLYCRSGNRSAIAAQKLCNAGFENITHLTDGINAWKEAGYPTQIDRTAPISLMRQVQIIAGSGIVIGTLLGAFVSPWFLLLSGFFGAGLVFSGITDTCTLGLLLSKLPYNQQHHA
jgi:rhodanese-related sulfurtransferase